MNNKDLILVTGAAGFIGYHLCKRLLLDGFRVVGLDNINDYYDVNLKFARLKQLGIEEALISYNSILTSSIYDDQFHFIKLNLEDRDNLPKLFNQFSINQVCNLAAQAGVRYSLENPMAYVDSNIVGFVNLLECIRNFKVSKLVYASSSSVYGLNKKVPFNTTDNVDFPISLYAATKKSNELMAYSYSHLYNIETIGLRFFTVYGPWGRPDMAMFLFTEAIINNKPINIFNNGDLARDFTFIDDIIDGVCATIYNNLPENENYKLYNIGKGSPIKLLDFVSTIEHELGNQAEKRMMAMQSGDVKQTWADTENLQKDFNYTPNTTIEIGVAKFIKWYKDFYNK